MEGKPSAFVPALPISRKPEPPREFNRFRERQFLKVAEAAKMLNAQGYEAIVGSAQVKWRLYEMGIKSVYDQGIANEDEVIMNRSRARADSNFFVFMKFDNFKSVAFFTDPSRGRAGRALTKEELMRRKVSRGNGPLWASEVAKEALEASEKKPREVFYSIVHGHWGENKDMDDGVSSRKDVIRQMMLWHYDIDATGYHNWVDSNALADIALRERNAGIVKVPSLELTLPFGLGALKDPHFNLWFAGKEAAEDFYQKFLRGRKATKFPGMAPEVEKRAVLKYVSGMRKEGEIAFGVAHPSCIVKAGVPLRMGILNLLGEKTKNGVLYTWRAIKEFIKKYADGVAAFNPTVDDHRLRFREKAVQKYFEENVWKEVSVSIGRQGEEETQAIAGYAGEAFGKLRENNVNMAIAKAMRRDYRKFAYFDHDTHNYAPFRFERAASPLAYGRNTVAFSNPAAFAALRKKGGLTSADFIKILRERKCEGYDVEIGMETFLELHNGRLRPVEARRSPFYGLLCLGKDIYHGWLNLKYAAMEGWRRARNAAENP